MWVSAGGLRPKVIDSQRKNLLFFCCPIRDAICNKILLCLDIKIYMLINSNCTRLKKICPRQQHIQVIILFLDCVG